ncbi:MAG: permease [Pseudooceanicola sp.]
MTDLSTSPGGGLRHLWSRVDGAIAATAAVLLILLAIDPGQAGDSVVFAAGAIWQTAPIIAFAVLAIGYMKASGAETLLSKAFTGREGRMILMAALLGGLSPFCSCQVIPFVAAMLALGVPLSAVMAFWLSSPLMDPGMFLVTAGTLGPEFAIGKTVAAVALGLFGGTVTMLARRSPVFAEPLRERPQVGGCCGVKKPYEGSPVWKFWGEADRRETFRHSVQDNAFFLLKWLVLAYVLESVMLAYVPADWVAGILGGEGLTPILLGAVVGAPAYLNGYAAVPLVDALLMQGMAPGAAMSFVIAGGVSCIPAAVAVWALVKPRVFAAYIVLAVVGAVMAGIAWQLVA